MTSDQLRAIASRLQQIAVAAADPDRTEIDVRAIEIDPEPLSAREAGRGRGAGDCVLTIELCVDGESVSEQHRFDESGQPAEEPITIGDNGTERVALDV